MIEKARKKAPPVNLGNKGNKNCPFREISGVGQRESPINKAIALIALISLITPISYFRGEYPCPTVFTNLWNKNDDLQRVLRVSKNA